jgi:deoxyribodipyrimidine photo-lyase
MHRVILWFKNDIRLHDNPIIDWAIRQPACSYKEFVPVFCFDPRYYSKDVDTLHPTFGTRKTGIWRARFQLESVSHFRQSLKGIGSGLLITNEKPEDFLSKLIKPGLQNTIVYSQESMDEEIQIEKAVKQRASEADGDC